MNWQKEQPTEPGMYLSRHDKSAYPVPVKVKRVGSGLVCHAHGYAPSTMKEMRGEKIEWMPVPWGDK